MQSWLIGATKGKHWDITLVLPASTQHHALTGQSHIFYHVMCYQLFCLQVQKHVSTHTCMHSLILHGCMKAPCGATSGGQLQLTMLYIKLPYWGCVGQAGQVRASGAVCVFVYTWVYLYVLDSAYHPLSFCGEFFVQLICSFSQYFNPITTQMFVACRFTPGLAVWRSRRMCRKRSSSAYVVVSILSQGEGWHMTFKGAWSVSRVHTTYRQAS